MASHIIFHHCSIYIYTKYVLKWFCYFFRLIVVEMHDSFIRFTICIINVINVALISRDNPRFCFVLMTINKSNNNRIYCTYCIGGWLRPRYKSCDEFRYTRNRIIYYYIWRDCCTHNRKRCRSVSTWIYCASLTYGQPYTRKNIILYNYYESRNMPTDGGGGGGGGMGWFEFAVKNDSSKQVRFFFICRSNSIMHHVIDSSFWRAHVGTARERVFLLPGLINSRDAIESLYIIIHFVWNSFPVFSRAAQSKAEWL